jgi:hypothetical protein
VVKFYFNEIRVENIIIDVSHIDNDETYITTRNLMESAPKEIDVIRVLVDNQFLHAKMYRKDILLKETLTPLLRVSNIDIEYANGTIKP